MATAQQRYYLKNKNDDTFQAKNRAWRKAYYDTHKEDERRKALERYYKRKEAAAAAEAHQQEITVGSPETIPAANHIL